MNRAAEVGMRRVCQPSGPMRSPRIAATNEQDVSARVHELLLLMYPPGPPLERRVDRRFPYPELIRVTPVDDEGRQLSDQSIVVAGKTLSERGLGFYHPEPLPHRRMVASFHAGDDRWLGILVDLTWCRFTCHGWYESGGRFLEAVPAIRPVRRETNG